MIPQHTIHQIVESARIEEVVGDFLTLKRRGANYIANCPFHGEKTPSFYVSPAKGIYKCFGCGAAGNSVKFVMEHEKMGYPDALRYVAKKYGIEVEEIAAPSSEQQAEQQLHDSLYIINQFAAEHFQRNLLMTDEGRSVGGSYFKDRHLSEATIRKFGLGYSMERNNALLAEAREKGYAIPLLKELGLASDRYERDADFFRARVMFPIHNASGKVVAFAGRTLQNDKKIPKYVNSPETPIYHKSQVLYGLWLARTDIRRKDECWLVEGYLDVISLVQAGIENVVASSGTSLTQEQIKLIKRYTENIVILYDGDTAGINAALRGMELIIEEGLNVRIALLPDGHDPDTYIYKVGSAVFEQYVQQNAKDFVLFKTDLRLRELNNDPVKKSVLLKDIIATVAKVADNIKRAFYVRECSRLFEVEEQMIVAEINKIKLQKLQKQQQDADNRRANPTINRQVGNTNLLANGEHDMLMPPPDEEVIYEHLTDGEPSHISPRHAAAKENQSLVELQQRDSIEQQLLCLLLEHGQRDMYEGIPAAAYLVHELQHLPFEKELYRQIIAEYRQALEKGDVLTADYFVQHSHAHIATLAAQLLSNPYELSHNWEHMHGIMLADATFRYKDEIADLLNRYKLFLLNVRLDEITWSLKQAQKDRSENGDAELMTLLNTQKELLEQRKTLSKALGVEIVR